ncbi:MAG: sulfatase-like hydrolase/transferase, partial [Bythopirellula sp.]
PLPDDEVDPWGVFQLANTTNSFMEERVSNNEPFFVQVSHKSVHAPVRSRALIREKYENLPPGTVHFDPAYAAMTEDLDTSVGMVMDKITELGIEDNTYFVYVSDNGAPLGFSKSTPLRSGKATLYEGGIRSPFIVTGPNIGADTVSDVPVTTTDLFSTFADLAGNQGPLPATVEGASLTSIFENGGALPYGVDHLSRKFHEGGELYWHFPLNFAVNSSVRTRPASAVRDGDFKLLVQYGEDGAPNDLFLYNLADDLSESINLADSMPAKTAELKAKLDRYLDSVDASFAFNVKQDVTIEWNPTRQGAELDRWRSTIDLDYKGRETWKLGEASSRPSRILAESFQPGLPEHVFRFDSGDQMNRLFFQVGDDGPYKASVASGTPDYDRSVTMEFWVRIDSLTGEQVLLESGDGTGGISATLGDADSDGQANDLRFRILGLTGPDGGLDGTLNNLTVSTKIDHTADPTKDFIHLVTVFNDDPNNRYGEIYVNGALAGRVDGLSGIEQSLQWDGYDDSGLGNIGGSGLGGNGGAGDLPFSGGFAGEFSLVRFYNHALSAGTIQNSYNDGLAPAAHGIAGTAGDVFVPFARPTNVSLGAAESSSLMIVQERDDTLDAALAVDALILGPETLNAANGGTSGGFLAGSKFTSFLLHFDPLENDPSSTEIATGSVDFDREIIAILFDDLLLANTDPILGALGNYGDQTDRGFDLTGSDFLAISADRKTLSFSLSIPGDELLQIRVLTEQPIVGDFNNDGLVNGADSLIWESSFGLDNGADADLDGDSDGRDFLALQRQFGLSGSLATSQAIPEPSTLMQSFLAMLAIACVQRSCSP